MCAGADETTSMTKTFAQSWCNEIPSTNAERVMPDADGLAHTANVIFVFAFFLLQTNRRGQSAEPNHATGRRQCQPLPSDRKRADMSKF